MTSFAEFESALIAALPQERSDLQGLHGASEAQLSAWIEHLFRRYLGYAHWKEITRAEGATIGAKGSKQLFPDLRIDVLDNGLIFVECKRTGRLDGPKGPEELNDAVSQLRTYIRAHVDRSSIKPKTVLGVVTDGNHWFLMGLNRTNDFHTIAEWAFLTDDPRLLAQRLWLLAKPALAQPTSALVEFLARRTLAEVLKGKVGWLTRKVNETLPGGTITDDLIGKWLRDAFSDPAGQSRLAPTTSHPIVSPQLSDITTPSGDDFETSGETTKRKSGSRPDSSITLADIIRANLITPPIKLFRRYKGTMLEANLLADGTVEFQGKRYDSCSAAAETARATVAGRRMNTNGWTFWQYLGVNGKNLTLHDARHNVPASAGEDADEPKEDLVRPERWDLRLRFWKSLLNRPGVQNTRHAGLTPGESTWISAGSGMRGLPYVYVIGKDDCRVELYIDRGADSTATNKRIFDQLSRQRNEIEVSFGSALSWQRLDDKRACRIAFILSVGGYRSGEAKWPAIQDAMIDAMIRLEKALAPHLARLRKDLASEGV